MKIIKNVQRYQLRDASIVYYDNFDKNVYYFLDLKLVEIKRIEVSRCHWFFDSDNYFKIGYDGNNERMGYFIDINLEKLLFYSYISIKDNIGVAYDYTNCYDNSHKETLIQLPEEKQILSDWLPNRIFHIQDQYWCNDTDEDFKLIDVEKGEILWTISQPEVEKPYGYNGLTNIKKVLGIYQGKLWLQLPDSRLWILDIESGTLLKELKHEYFIVHERGTYFDKEEGVIKILYYNLYAKYSLDLMDFVEEADLGAPEIFQVTSMISRPKDKYIYYTAKLNDVSMISNAYGIFDTEKKKVIFQGEEIEVDGHFYQEPQVNDELFTILDSKGNLIIHNIKDILPTT